MDHTTAKPTITPIQYEVSLLPREDIDFHARRIVMEYRGRDLWLVKHLHSVLCSDGTWNWGESSDDLMNEHYLARHRFDFETARRLAEEVVHTVRFRGQTTAQMLAERAKARQEA